MRTEEEPGPPAVQGSIRDLLPAADRRHAIDEIVEGLTAQRKRISSKYFYDAEGSRLFEEITRLPEYYLTRTEKGLLEEVAVRLAPSIEGSSIVEIGSGDCSKISMILEAVPAGALPGIRYIPFDISRAAMEKASLKLIERFPGLEIQGLAGDFLRQLDMIPDGGRRLFCFLGSTVGNLSKGRAVRFFEDLSSIMEPGERLLLGVDTVKEREVLELAYNDGRGVTAEFNRNILRVVNRIAGTDFEPEAFDHVAFYNDVDRRIEMHLRSREGCLVACPHLSGPILVEKDEMIHTENSHKFEREDVELFASALRAEVTDVFEDERRRFALFLLTRIRG